MSALANLTTPQSKGQISISRMNPTPSCSGVLLTNHRVYRANCLLHRIDVFFPGQLRRSRSRTAPSARRLCLSIAAIAISMTFSCGTQHAILNFSAPATATAGSPFTVTVTVTVGGTRDTIINSVISFTSSDPAAVLPASYQFTSADAGSHTWTNGFTLITPGNQTISASIFDASGINGTASVTVSP